MTVKYQVSNTIITNNGSPHGCILSLLLFGLYTNGLRSYHPDVQIIKYADDTLIVGNIVNDDSTRYRNVIDVCVDWCTDNKLVLNETKTKELIFDFRRIKAPQEDIVIKNVPVEIVHSFKYLGCIIDDKLTFQQHADYVLKKACQRRFLVYQLYSFNINKTFIALAYSALVRSTLQYCVPIFFAMMNKKNQKKFLTMVHIYFKTINYITVYLA